MFGARLSADNQQWRTTMKLFALRNTSTNKIKPDTFFANKMLAKKARDLLVEQTNQPHVVTYGPDHRKYKA